jgi:hypothetical protein
VCIFFSVGGTNSFKLQPNFVEALSQQHTLHVIRTGKQNTAISTHPFIKKQTDIELKVSKMPRMAHIPMFVNLLLSRLERLLGWISSNNLCPMLEIWAPRAHPFCTNSL